MPSDAPGADAVVFGQIETEDRPRTTAYDIPGQAAGSAEHASSTRRENGTTITDQPFFVSVRGDSLEEVRGYWDKLARGGGVVVEPPASSAWSPGFGMLTDRFDVTWILDVTAS